MNIQLFSNLISKYVKEGSVPTTFEGSAKLFENEVVKKLLPTTGDITPLLKTFDEISAVISSQDTKKRDIQLHKLNKDLLTKTFIFADQLSALDLAYYVILYNWMGELTDKERFVFCNITRWFNLIQNQTPIANVQSLIAISTTPPPPEKKEEKKPAAGAAATGASDKKEENKKEKKPQQPKAVEPAKPVDVSRFEIRVGKIVECKKHENADSLYVEKIDLGEAAPRQIVSGLVKFIPLETMIGHRVLVLCNLKPSNLKSVRSEGMVLCASNADHTQVEFVEPPAGAVIGERVMFDQFPGEFDKVLKSDIVGPILADLSTNADKIATYKGNVFQTTAGPCTSKTLANCHIA